MTLESYKPEGTHGQEALESNASHQLEDLISIGPRTLIAKSLMRKILKESRAYKKGGKEVLMALFAETHDGVFLVKHYSIVQGVANAFTVNYESTDIKNLAAEFAKDGIMFMGLLHTHLNSSAEPSDADKRDWLFWIFEYKNPLMFFVLSLKDLNVSCYAVSYEEWLRAKEAIKSAETALTGLDDYHGE